MVRAYTPTRDGATGQVTPFEEAHVIRHMAPERDQRYRDLVERMREGTLTPKERLELRTLVQESEQLAVENARAMLRHRDPDAYTAALAEEQRIAGQATSRSRRRRSQAR